MHVYFISGLAADHRVFKNLVLPPHCTPVYLNWIDPKPGETLAQYALRLAAPIDATQPFALVGLSFGGMLAVEIAQQLHPVVTLLISSMPNSAGLPFYYTLAGRLRLHKLVPMRTLKQLSLLKRFFTTETSEDKIILKHMIRNSNPQFIAWCINAVLTWRFEKVVPHLVHIHGTRDGILPARFVKPTHLIKKGGHLMVLNHAAEISAILATELQKSPHKSMGF